VERCGGEPGPQPFFLTHIEGMDGKLLRRCAENYGRAYLAAIFGDELPHPLCEGAAAPECSSQHRPLRIGFLSADFRSHAVSELAVGIFEGLERPRFAVIGYAYGPDDRGPLRKRLQDAFDLFRDVDGLSFLDAAKAIREDEIDILIDMAGWTSSTRLAILAYRPAPVIAHWLGFPGTLGLKGIVDYLISDKVVTPLDNAADYAEDLALLPHSYQPSSRGESMRRRPTRAEVGLPDDAFVFCSFNQSIKITPPVFGLWCEVLRRNVNSVLWIGFQDVVAQANLLRSAASMGIAPERFVFAPWAPVAEHWDRLGLADLALDTFPYGGHATASDLLWAGVPLLAWEGDTFASRVAASLLNSVGLPELVARSEKEYLHLATTLAASPEDLRKVKAKLANARSHAPLFDTERFSRDFGRLLEAMWANRLSGVTGPISLATN
jgi:predicted O-linked N-acetylglucosamine transferase (SPINDLY family)